MANINLQQSLCADPINGGIYRHLFNGGSWFEADQMYWRVRQEEALASLKALVEEKASKSNKTKAAADLAVLKEAAAQLLPTQDSLAAFQAAETIVKTWETPKVLPKTANAKGKNAFSLLDDDE
jgi:hypothetical protein